MFIKYKRKQNPVLMNSYHPCFIPHMYFVLCRNLNPQLIFHFKHEQLRHLRLIIITKWYHNAWFLYQSLISLSSSILFFLNKILGSSLINKKN